MSADTSWEPTSRVPPGFLVDRVLPVGDASELEHLQSFFASGARSLAELERALRACDRSLSDYSTLLDWGCGPGRVTLRIVDKYPNLKVTGIDTDIGSIEWLSSSVPEAVFLKVDPNPPVPLNDGGFDIVVNHSVLTHIDHEPQSAWLAEIARLLRTDGIFVTSVHGVHAFIQSLDQLEDGYSDNNPWLAAWRQDRFVFVAEDTFTGSSHHDGYHTTFQDAATVEKLANFEFEPLATLYRGDLGFQDLLVFRRRSSDEAAKRRSIEPAAGYKPTEAQPIAVDNDSRLARLERTSMLASISLNQLGRQIARLEELVANRQR